MSHYSIGDVQGCFTELSALLKKINFNPNQDVLWFVGDLVNRGSQSLEVLRLIKSLGNAAVVVLGNHDLHLLAAASGQRKVTISDTFDDILNAPDREELCEWLRHRPLLHHDPVLGYTMMHAGLPPQWTLEQALQYAHEVETILRSAQYPQFFAHMYGNDPNQWSDTLTGWPRLRLITNYLARMRFCDSNGTLNLSDESFTKAPPGYFPWFKVPNRVNKNLKIIFGHWAALNGKTDEPNVYALDTGCIWGKCLTAMRLEDGEHFSVSCEQYQKP